MSEQYSTQQTKSQQQESGLQPDDSAKLFIDLLNNRAKHHEPDSGDLPTRDRGFVVIARDGLDLWPLQALCSKKHQEYNECLTARYRFRPGVIFGSLLAAFLVDLLKIGRGSTDDLAGVFFPGAADVAWKRFLNQGRTDPVNRSPLEAIERLIKEQPESDLDKERLDALLDLLSSEDVLSPGKRLVLFAEVEQSRTDADEQEWNRARTILFDRLPERVGLVVSGAPPTFELGEAPHFLELLSRVTTEDPPPPSDPRFSFKQGSLLSDRPTEIDTLGIKNDAEALARFVLHPQTDPPLTIGIHGPWGKGKSSFMKLVEDALIDKALDDLGARTDPDLARLKREKDEREQKVEHASEAQSGDLRNQFRAKSVEYDERRKHLAEPEVVTVNFNAWQFEDAKQIWAGLASVISERLELALPWRRHMRMRLLYAWEKRRSELLLNVALPVLLGFAILLYLVFGGLDQFKAALDDAGASDLVLRALLASLLPLGSLVFLIWFASKQILSVVQPMSQRVLSYIQLPTYREQMGYQHRVMEDLYRVYNCLKWHEDRGSKVVVFIDDLDRCSEEKIMEVLQAITLILGDSKFFVFLGMDTEMIYRAVRAHYASDQTGDNTLPSNFPEEYLHKIIQISFYLPKTSDGSRRVYLDSLFSAASRQTGEPTVAGQTSGPHGNGKQAPPSAADGRLPVDFSYILHSPPVEVEDTPAELDTFKKHLQFLEDNPRAVKRLINLHRLVKIILTVKQQQLLTREEEQRKLVRWLLFCARWPELVDDCINLADECTEDKNDDPSKTPDTDVLKELLKTLKGQTNKDKEGNTDKPEEPAIQAEVDQSDHTLVSPPPEGSLAAFADFDECGHLSAQDIKNLKLSAQISTLIRESIAAP